MMKRALDLAASGVGLLLLSPLLVCIALAVRLTSAGPVLFRQERVGRDFRRFRIFKFRTMVADAPLLGGSITAGERDPRITSLGRVLRKTKLDELPQLMNVLVGDMSLVGPRPEVPRFVEMFRADYEEILRVRPGITDLASVKYRDEASYLGQHADTEGVYVRDILPDKIKLAKRYVEQRSLLLDLKLIYTTVLGGSAGSL